MARLQEIRGLAEYTAKDVSSSPKDWMKYLDTAGKAVPLSVLGYTSDPCPASGCNRLCVTGSMESEDGSMGKSWGERNRPDR